jgi:small subunit ribosomal protein S20
MANFSARIRVMPISLSAKASLRKARKNQKVNLGFKRVVKKTVKEFLQKPSADGLKKVFSMLDKAVKKEIFHKNKAARLKSKYSKKIVKEVKAKGTKEKMSEK